MKNNFTTLAVLILIALMLPHCQARKRTTSTAKDPCIALAVEYDMLKSVIQRRLAEMERETAPGGEVRTQAKIEAVSASEPVHQ